MAASSRIAKHLARACTPRRTRIPRLNQNPAGRRNVRASRASDWRSGIRPLAEPGQPWRFTTLQRGCVEILMILLRGRSSLSDGSIGLALGLRLSRSGVERDDVAVGREEGAAVDARGLRNLPSTVRKATEASPDPS